MAVLACEQELRPRRAALLVVRPLHLVEHEHLARAGAISTVQQRIGACSLTRSSPVTSPTRSSPSSPTAGGAPPGRASAAVPRRRPSPLREEPERVVGLARVRRPEVRDDALGRRPALRQPDRDPVLGALHRGALVGPCGAGVTRRARRAPRRAGAAARAIGPLSRISPTTRGLRRFATQVRPVVGTTLRYLRSVSPEPRAPTASPTTMQDQRGDREAEGADVVDEVASMSSRIEGSATSLPIRSSSTAARRPASPHNSPRS